MRVVHILLALFLLIFLLDYLRQILLFVSGFIGVCGRNDSSAHASYRIDRFLTAKNSTFKKNSFFTFYVFLLFDEPLLSLCSYWKNKHVSLQVKPFVSKKVLATILVCSGTFSSTNQKADPEEPFQRLIIG